MTFFLRGSSGCGCKKVPSFSLLSPFSFFFSLAIDIRIPNTKVISYCTLSNIPVANTAG